MLGSTVPLETFPPPFPLPSSLPSPLPSPFPPLSPRKPSAPPHLHLSEHNNNKILRLSVCTPKEETISAAEAEAAEAAAEAEAAEAAAVEAELPPPPAKEGNSDKSPPPPSADAPDAAAVAAAPGAASAAADEDEKKKTGIIKGTKGTHIPYTDKGLFYFSSPEGPKEPDSPLQKKRKEFTGLPDVDEAEAAMPTAALRGKAFLANCVAVRKQEEEEEEEGDRSDEEETVATATAEADPVLVAVSKSFSDGKKEDIIGSVVTIEETTPLDASLPVGASSRSLRVTRVLGRGVSSIVIEGIDIKTEEVFAIRVQVLERLQLSEKQTCNLLQQAAAAEESCLVRAAADVGAACAAAKRGIMVPLYTAKMGKGSPSAFVWGDFGSSAPLGEALGELTRVTMDYAEPQLLLDLSRFLNAKDSSDVVFANIKSDLWSLGVVLYELFTDGKLPYALAGFPFKFFVSRAPFI
ncbi:hypothetical protein EMWEY_00036630 [Eimeria maxima]|uniref:Protein kinase domain-containing protein n=1 Tax=Eimeria maxima TaxID=5804 RepID=U6MH44_EIMMA|nr:hypothetical protein EMWEY_00036630 [Eimeria maxima]CDJ60970.1 hypothetical protein EMWEY_00036630 [Eimeria maxima]